LNDDLAIIARTFRIDRAKLAEVQQAILRNAGPLVSDNMLCAGDPSPSPQAKQVRDACQGDSGGPLLVAKEDSSPLQVGIIC
jgi:secreted trypsin-like serine protease